MTKVSANGDRVPVVFASWSRKEDHLSSLYAAEEMQGKKMRRVISKISEIEFLRVLRNVVTRHVACLQAEGRRLEPLSLKLRRIVCLFAGYTSHIISLHAVLEPFKDETKCYIISTQCVPRSIHSSLRL